jgi:hypothetical protein
MKPTLWQYSSREYWIVGNMYILTEKALKDYRKEDEKSFHN